jgi:hypothetical protein
MYIIASANPDPDPDLDQHLTIRERRAATVGPGKKRGAEVELTMISVHVAHVLYKYKALS